MSSPTATYAPCDQCGAPLDAEQRYCVVCGSSRHHAADPLARFLAARRRRPTTAAAVVVPARPRERWWIAAALALLPVVAAIGVLVGRGNAGDNGAILAALRTQKAPVVQVGAGTGAATSDAAGATTAKAVSATSDFTLARGFVVELRTVPHAAAVAAAKRAAQAKGATRLGVIVAKDFRLSSGAGGPIVLYSGQFRTRAHARRALAKLRRRFPAAKVIAVSPAAGAASASAKAVATQTHATAKQKAAGKKVVQEIQRRKGKSYVDQQRNLPDTIVVP